MEKQTDILIIDDEPQLRQMIARLLQAEGYEVTQAADYKSGMKCLEKNLFPLVLCDVKLPDGNGVDICLEIKTRYPTTEIILLTAYGNIPDGVQAIKNGAFNYLVKGDDNNKIIPIVSSAMDKALMVSKVAKKKNGLAGSYIFNDIIGASPLIFHAIELAKKVAYTDTTVLLNGETGTGKEIFASAIHNESSRSRKPFVAVNCSTFSSEILESELFGHKAGAFTGAIKDKKGLMEEADKGTLFLDEIGEMPAMLQAKLLRVLENGEYLKVGDTKPQKADVRIIAATNRNLQDECEKGNFRMDLFYRLSAFQISLPALNDRKQDIAALAAYFIKYFAAKMNRPCYEMDKIFLKRLEDHNWKGNIRELKNVIERAMIICDGEQLTVDCLPFEMQSANNQQQLFDAFDLAGIEKKHIQKVLLHTKGNKTETARLLNIGLTTLYRKIDEYSIKSSGE